MSQGQQQAHEVAGDQAGESQSPVAPDREVRIAHLLAIVEAQFGERLDEAGRARVREQLGRQVDGSAQLAAAVAALENGDEPDFTFSPYREG